jgi:hypothetical protein
VKSTSLKLFKKGNISSLLSLLLSYKEGIFGRPRIFTWKCVHLTNYGPLNVVVIAVCLPGHSRVITAHLINITWAHHEYRTATLWGQKDTFATGHISSGLTHSYTIDVATSVPQKLAHTCFQEHEGKFGKIVHAWNKSGCPHNIDAFVNTTAVSLNYGLETCFVKLWIGDMSR